MELSKTSDAALLTLLRGMQGDPNSMCSSMVAMLWTVACLDVPDGTPLRGACVVAPPSLSTGRRPLVHAPSDHDDDPIAMTVEGVVTLLEGWTRRPTMHKEALLGPWLRALMVDAAREQMFDEAWWKHVVALLGTGGKGMNFKQKEHAMDIVKPLVKHCAARCAWDEGNEIEAKKQAADRLVRLVALGREGGDKQLDPFISDEAVYDPFSTLRTNTTELQAPPANMGHDLALHLVDVAVVPLLLASGPCMAFAAASRAAEEWKRSHSAKV